MATYTIIEEHRPVTIQELQSDSSPWYLAGLAGQGLSRVYTFKKFACRCNFQALDGSSLYWNTFGEFSGFNGKVGCMATCTWCSFKYDAKPTSICVEDLLININKKIEILHTRTIKSQDLEPVFKMVKKKLGSFEYETTEPQDEEGKLRYHYPNKEYRKISTFDLSL